MKDFIFYNPTKIFFGKNSITNLEEQISDRFNNILIVYGSGRIKKNGLYDSVINILKKKNKKYFELDGVTPNPRLNKVYEGINICKKNNIDLVLAIGGGSVIDCSKAIALGAKSNVDIWENYYKGKKECGEVLSVGVILTISATGSEMNNDSVITNWKSHEKLNYINDKLYPEFSILDPTYTLSLPREQTIYGSIDILIHIFEQYFSKPDTYNLSDKFSECLIKDVIENLNNVLNNEMDYDIRANLMWASTMALNGLIGLGKEQDWSSHNIAHALSALYDLPHGATLSIIFPAWMKYIYKFSIEKFKRYAIEIWNVKEENKTDIEIVEEGIEKTKQFFAYLGAPVSLKDVNISKDDIEKIIDVIDIDNAGSYKKINDDDIRKILNNCL